MVDERTIREILEAGIQAPSGENAQPWRLKIDGNTVLLFNNPESDQSLYNYEQSGSFVAHGTFLENVTVAARARGYEAEIKLFPDAHDQNFMASITFSNGKGETQKDLAQAIARRATNRKPYDTSPLSAAEEKEILACADGDARLVMVDDRAKIAELARAASVNETMLIRNKGVHDFFFSHVRWTLEENELQPNGFYIKTLELKPPQEGAFKLLRRWGAAKFLARLGMARAIGKDNEKIYASASAMVGVVIRNRTPENLVHAGRVLERAWLTATKLGLSVQPSTGALFLAEGISGENYGSFSAAQRADLLAAKKTVYEMLGVNEKNEHVAVLFRVGRSEPPSARAARFPMEAFLSETAMKEERALPKIAEDRHAVIEHILNDLETLRDNPSFKNQYAVQELIAFYRAIRSYPSYVRWLIRRAPKLDRARILELTDLPFPRWDRAMHEKLIEMESRKFPGLVGPLVDRLIALIMEKGNSRFAGLHLGSGGREVDRQVIEALIGKKHHGQVVLVGIDNSPIASEVAKANLRGVEPFIAIHETETLTKAGLDEILKKETRRHVIIFAKNDIFSLPREFPHGSFDVVYHTLFKHHLTDGQKAILDDQVVPLGKTVLEYDGLKNWPFLIGPHTWSSWRNPPLMNGSIFSNLRYYTKKEVQRLTAQQGGRLFISRVATYLIERTSI